MRYSPGDCIGQLCILNDCPCCCLLCLKSFKYRSWSFHCVMILMASSMNVTTMRKRPIAGRYLQSLSEFLFCSKDNRAQCSRFKWLSHRIQIVFYLAGLLSDLIEWTGIVRRIVVTSWASKLVIHAQVVPCGTSDLCHDMYRYRRAEGEGGVSSFCEDVDSGITGLFLAHAAMLGIEWQM